MKTVIVVDAACDLPGAYIRQNQLQVLPIMLVSDDRIITDTRDANLTLAFHHRHALARRLDMTVEPCPAETIAALFLERLIAEYDRGILITLSQTRSHLFQHATEASFAILRGYREKRRLAGLNTPFYLSVLDSQTLFAGQAVLVHETIRLLQDQDLTFNDLRRRIEEFRRYIRCFILFDDLFHARDRAGRPSEKIGFLDYHLGSLLDIKPVVRFHNGETELVHKARGFDKALAGLLKQTRRAIDDGLRNPLVVISYAGDPEMLQQKRSFIEFEHYARKWGVEIMLSIMSITGGANVGPGALSLAYATS